MHKKLEDPTSNCLASWVLAAVNDEPKGLKNSFPAVIKVKEVEDAKR